MFLIAWLFSTAVSVIIFVILAQIIIHWLIIFEVFKLNNFQARQLVQTLNQFAERFYRPVRRFVPLIGGIDLSPVVVIFGLQLLDSLVRFLLIGMFK